MSAENDGMTAKVQVCRASLVLLLMAVGACGRLEAAPPVIANLTVRGFQVGGTTTLTVQGSDFGASPRLLLPFAAKQDRKPGGNSQQAVFDVTLPADVVPGYYPLRLVAEGGISAPAIIGVDRLPQRPFAATNTELPVALHGSAIGGGAVETAFQGKAGQKVLIEVEAQRLGGKLRPVIHLYNRKRIQIGWSWGSRALHGDTRLEATLPEDGPYTIAVHDVEYAPPGPAFFRLKVGQWSFADRVFPPAVAAGKQTVELLGMASPVPAEVAAPVGAAALPLAWPKDGNWSGPRPFVTISPHPEVLEQAASTKGQDLPAGPVGVSGKLLTAFEEDRYRIPVQPGAKYRFEVFADRLGSPLDAALVIRNDAGLQLARADDAPGTLDPVLDFSVPDKTTAILVCVLDAQGMGGPKGLYHLTIEPQTAVTGRFRLLTPMESLSLPIGGHSVLRVLVERQGYEKAISLAADGLPPKVKLDGTAIPAGASGALVTVRADAPLADAFVSRFKGKGEDGQEQTIVVKDHPLARVQPWFATEIPLVTTTQKAADFPIDWGALAADAAIVPAKNLVLPVKVPRAAGKTLVKLELVTSQAEGAFGSPVDPNLLLRQAAPVELAANAVEGALTMVVPGELKSPVYDVAVRAEFLPPDRRGVLAVAWTPVRRMTVRMPLILSLAGPPRIEVKQDPKTGNTIPLKGKVERREGLAADVVLALTGLPPGARADAVTVKAGVADFALPIILPPNLPPGEIKGLKLAGTAIPDPKQPNIRVRSHEVEFALVLQPAAK
jgi:hypothetical protein